MYNYLAEKSTRAVNAIAGRGPELTARRKVETVFKANTVGARLKGIQQTETQVMREKIFEAQRSGDPEKVSAAVDDYRKLLAEVIALNGAAASKGADSALNWKSINKAVGRRNDNGDFVRMTQNLTADTVLSELDVLKEQPLNQFLTHQAERLNAAHQAAQQPQAQPEVQQPAAQRDRNEEFEEPKMLLN